MKAFGQMMVNDHSQANDELKKVASQLKIQLPTQLDQKHKDLVDKLSKLQGPECSIANTSTRRCRGTRKFSASCVRMGGEGHAEGANAPRSGRGAATEDRKVTVGPCGTWGPA